MQVDGPPTPARASTLTRANSQKERNNSSAAAERVGVCSGEGEWDMQGTLTKKGHVRTNWKQRTFRLRGARLLYFAGVC